MYAIKVYRSERGWSGTELARRSGVPREEISRFENGRKEPSAATLKKLADALGVTVHDLMLTEERFRGPLVEPPPPSVRRWLDEMGASHYLTMSDAEAREVRKNLTSDRVPEVKLSLRDELDLIREALDFGDLPPQFRTELEAAKKTFIQWMHELSQIVKRERKLQNRQQPDED